MDVRLRPARAGDAAVCGRIVYGAFKDVDERHGFAAGFRSLEDATRVAEIFIRLAAIEAILAEDAGTVVGAVFLDQGDPIKSVGLIAVDPVSQRRGVGRRLMEAAIVHAGEARGIRLVQEAFNTQAMGLYASLGFEVKEPLVAIAGRPKSHPAPGVVSRPITAGDLDECAALCRRVHGVDRTVDLRDALDLFTPIAVVRDGRIVAYSYIVWAGTLAWGVAETPEEIGRASC